MALEHKQQQNPRWVPTEIIVEILLRLPVKSLLRFKSVCKLWYSLISYQRFVKSHLTLSLCNPHYRLISIDNYLSCRLYDLETFGESFNVLELKNPFTAKDARARILGSCNGLLCIIVDESSIIIWNPSTRRVNILPHCDFRGRSRILDVRFGFGYDESNDDYKVVAIISSKRVKTYSLKSGCWKTLGDFPRGFIDQAIGIFLNGTLHWMTIRNSSSKNYLSTIVSFDLATETFGEILQPVYDKGHNYLTLCRLGEWLSVVCYYRGNRSDVWVMKVYGVQDSWTKLVSIPHLTTTMIPGSLMALSITHDGKYLLKLGNELVMYDPKSSSLSEKKIDIYSSAHTFIESLVSPMPKGVPAGSRDTHGFFNSIILRFKKICAPGHIWSCVRPCRWMPNVN